MFPDRVPADGSRFTTTPQAFCLMIGLRTVADCQEDTVKREAVIFLLTEKLFPKMAHNAIYEKSALPCCFHQENLKNAMSMC